MGRDNPNYATRLMGWFKDFKDQWDEIIVDAICDPRINLQCVVDLQTIYYLERNMVATKKKAESGKTAPVEEGVLPADLPKPNVDHADWVAAMVKLGERWINLHDYQLATNSATARLIMTECSRRITAGMQEGVLEASMRDLKDRRVNNYRACAAARAFWANGFEEGLTPREILDGWRAINSIAEDKPKDDD